MAVDAMKAGAFDFTEKPLDDQLLLDLVQKAVEKRLEVAQDHALREEIARRLTLLTQRERAVHDIVMLGEPNQRNALNIGIAAKTVHATPAPGRGKHQTR